jgi:hypothetical protein
MGIIGNTQGVRASNSPAPKKKDTISQKLCCLKICAIVRLGDALCRAGVSLKRSLGACCFGRGRGGGYCGFARRWQQHPDFFVDRRIAQAVFAAAHVRGLEDDGLRSSAVVEQCNFSLE